MARAKRLAPSCAGSGPGVVFVDDAGGIAVELIGGDDAIAELSLEEQDANHEGLREIECVPPGEIEIVRHYDGSRCSAGTHSPR
jgi:hypothetical protein